MNHFWKMWTEAVEKKNKYIPFEVHWSKVPGRDAKWMEQEIQNLGSQERFDQEYNTEFIGGMATLVAPSKLRSIPVKIPVEHKNSIRVYERPVPKATYVLTVDVGSGSMQDYSVVTVFRVDVEPYHICAIYQNHNVNTMLFPSVIEQMARNYNNGYCLIEINSIGKEVADIMQFDLEYENMLTTMSSGKKGQTLGESFTARGGHLKFGIDTSKRTKAIGCANLKALVESDRLTFHDFNLIQELSNFCLQPNGTYKANDGTDDIVMTCVLFGWLVNQDYFKDLTDTDIRKSIFDANVQAIEDDLLPFGFINSDAQGTEEVVVENTGQPWKYDNSRSTW